ncbi:DUF4240 domain-containing protein [Paraburkholderia tropica]|uniref:DUF4240 domain-containing protein n=1 Tax=Paraburkholderia tropica TaxID=92647 RepID=UPI001603DE4A|nr:DUF4240 domain-containing protein [Paraburkholderia tropica]QNB10292.1 DUF4240 domain-containing protein [Paraburkholderia tropica]
MNIDKFWEIMARCKESNDPMSSLGEILRQLPLGEVREFGRYFLWMEGYAFRWGIWGAAYLLNGGCRDDGFTDFRRGLILQGRTVYEAVLKDPDHLHTHWGQGPIDCEGIGCVAFDVYAEKMKISGEAAMNELYDYSYLQKPPTHIEGTRYDWPNVEDWDFDDEQENRKRLPRLAQLSSQHYESQLAQWAAIGGIAA